MHEEWGAIYHDFEGMTLDGDRVPLDYCHNEAEVLGFAGEFPVDEEGLHIDGVLVPFGQDRAAEVIAKGQAGVPYQLSIDFRGDDLVAEEVPEGATAEVNGATVEGPALIFREWPLRGVAVCPYGKDRNTSTQFSDQDGDVCSVRILSEGSMPKTLKKKPQAVRQMTAPKKPAAKKAPARKFTAAKRTPARQLAEEDEQQAEEDEELEEDDEAPAVEDGEEDDTVNDADPADAEEEPLDEDEEQQAEEDEEQKPAPDQQQSERSKVKSELARFVKAFGQKNGTAWYIDGKTFSQAQRLHTAAVEKELGRVKRQLTVAETRLQQLGESGEEEPLSLSNDDGDAPRGSSAPSVDKKYSATIGPKMGLFAQGIKLPTK